MVPSVGALPRSHTPQAVAGPSEADRPPGAAACLGRRCSTQWARAGVPGFQPQECLSESRALLGRSSSQDLPHLCQPPELACQLLLSAMSAHLPVLFVTVAAAGLCYMHGWGLVSSCFQTRGSRAGRLGRVWELLCLSGEPFASPSAVSKSSPALSWVGQWKCIVVI